MTLTLKTAGSLPIAFSDGPEHRNAFVYNEAPGLVIACLPLSRGGEASYSITHRKSGRKVGPYYYATIAEAEAALERIAPMLDWTEEMDALQHQLAMRGFAFAERFLAACKPDGKVAA